MIKCSDCGKVINLAEKQFCVLWELPHARFICMQCSDKPQYHSMQQILEPGEKNE